MMIKPIEKVRSFDPFQDKVNPVFVKNRDAVLNSLDLFRRYSAVLNNGLLFMIIFSFLFFNSLSNDKPVPLYNFFFIVKTTKYASFLTR